MRITRSSTYTHHSWHETTFSIGLVRNTWTGQAICSLETSRQWTLKPALGANLAPQTKAKKKADANTQIIQLRIPPRSQFTFLRLSLLPLPSVLGALTRTVASILKPARHRLQAIANRLRTGRAVDRVTEALACGADDAARGLRDTAGQVAKLSAKLVK